MILLKKVVHSTVTVDFGVVKLYLERESAKTNIVASNSDDGGRGRFPWDKVNYVGTV